MKRLSWVTGLLSALAVVLAAAGALLGAVYNAAIDPALYAARSREAVAQLLAPADEEEITAYIGLTAQEQEEAAQQIALYMELSSGEALLSPQIECDGQSAALFGEREQLHMRDVRGLVQLAGNASKACVSAAAALAVAIAWTGAQLARRRRAVLLGVACGLCVLLLAALGVGAAMNTAGFERLFVGMHGLLFDNDLWLLNPQTDVLIRMMPQTLFEAELRTVALAALRAFALLLAMLALLYILVGGMVRRSLSERERA